MDQERLTHLDQRFARAREYAQGLAVETCRQFDVVAVGFQGDLRLGRRITPRDAVSADLEGRLARLDARR